MNKSEAKKAYWERMGPEARSTHARMMSMRRWEGVSKEDRKKVSDMLVASRTDLRKDKKPLVTIEREVEKVVAEDARPRIAGLC